MSSRIRHPWLRRPGIAAVAVGLIAGMLAVTGAPAQAHPHQAPERTGNHCVLPGHIDLHILDPGTDDWVWGYDIQWANLTFRTAWDDGVSNNSDVVSTQTVTVQQSQTYTFSTTNSSTNTVSSRIVEGLERATTVSTTATVSTTVSAGTTISVPVPPRTRMEVDRIVEVYEIGYVFYVYHRDKNNPSRACRQQGVTGIQTMFVPTDSHKWQINQFPMSATASTYQ